MSLYEEITSWSMPANVLPESIRLMAPDGKKGNEGIVMWLGQIQAGAATVTHLVAFEDNLLCKRPDYLQIPSAVMNAVADVSEKMGVSLIGQIHSHPGNFVDLSIADRRYGISAPYYLSVVAPYYAQRPNTSWRQCGVHQFVARQGFRRFSADEITRRISETPDQMSKTIMLGFRK